MWARSGRDIGAAYAREGSTPAALAKLAPAVPTLHICAQSGDPTSLPTQQAFADEHSWFRVKRRRRAGDHRIRDVNIKRI